MVEDDTPNSEDYLVKIKTIKFFTHGKDFQKDYKQIDDESINGMPWIP